MRLLLLITFSSILRIGNAQIEFTTFLNLNNRTFDSFLSGDVQKRLIFFDNRLDSTPIIIKGLGNGRYQKFQLDSSVFVNPVGNYLKQSRNLSPGDIILVLNELRYYNTSGQARGANGKLVRIKTNNLLKINFILFSFQRDFSGEPIRYLGRLNRFYETDDVNEASAIFANAITESLGSESKLAPEKPLAIESNRKVKKIIIQGEDLTGKQTSIQFDSIVTPKSSFQQTLGSILPTLGDSVCIFKCFQDMLDGRSQVVADSLEYDESLGLVQFSRTSKNRRIFKNCWGVIYGHSFYVRFAENYFFEISLDKRSGTFRVPDYLSDMRTLHSSGYRHAKLNWSVNHRRQAPASSSVPGAIAGILVQQLTNPPAKPASRVTFLNLTSYSTAYRDCRIDPFSGDIIYDYGRLFSNNSDR